MSPRLAAFVGAVERSFEGGAPRCAQLATVTRAMRELVAMDDWLPAECAQPHPAFYQQYLLHLDAEERFSVVSFVWGPGQCTPIHDHTVWGVVGMLRGRECSEQFERTANGMLPVGTERLAPGEVSAFSPQAGDIHRVCNALEDGVSISIHAYGANIGQVRRHVFDRQSGQARDFVSGYANRVAA